VDPLAATFTDGTLTLALGLEGGAPGRYTGRLALQGQTYPVSAEGTPDRLRGRFQVGAEAFAFEASLAGEVLTLTSDGTRYTLKRQPPAGEAAPGAPRNPLGAPGRGAGEGAWTPPPAPDPAGAPRRPVPLPPELPGYVFYRHPLGLVLQHPAGWRVEQTPLGLALVPPDLATNEYGPTEAFLIMAEKLAPGIDRPDDPRIGQYLDMQTARTIPFLSRRGAPEPATAGVAPAAVYAYSGRNQLGREILARVHVTLAEGYAFGLTALGERPRVEVRREVVERIFSSFAVGAPQVDPRLVGIWYTTKTASSRATGDFNLTTVIAWAWGPDGRYARGAQTAFSGTIREGGTGDPTHSYTGGADSADIEKGRWATDGTKVWFVADKGGAWEYQVQLDLSGGMRRLLLRPAGGGEPELWSERPE
jgi:hypothetical protein